MVKKYVKIICITLLFSLSNVELQAIAWKEIGICLIGGLSLLDPFGWLFKRWRRKHESFFETVHRKLTGCCSCFTCCEPERQEHAAENSVINSQVLALAAARWGVKTVHILIPVVIASNEHRIFHEEVPENVILAYTVWLSTMISRRVKKWEQQESSVGAMQVLIENATVGVFSAVLVKIEADVFFILAPLSSPIATTFLVVSALAAKPIVTGVGYLAAAASKKVCQWGSSLLSKMKNLCSACCRKKPMDLEQDDEMLDITEILDQELQEVPADTRITFYDQDDEEERSGIIHTNPGNYTIVRPPYPAKGTFYHDESTTSF